MMNRKTLFAGLAAVLLWSGAARASDPIGGFAVIDKLVLEPNDEAPTRAQVWGTFSLVTERGGRSFGKPERGYLYYAADANNEAACRKEWADMKKVAGTSQIVGFGSSFKDSGMGRVRKATDKPETPDVYPVGFGLHKLRPSTDYSPVRELCEVPFPAAPAENDLVPPGEITLAVRNVLGEKHAKAKYVFEIQGDSGDKETSPPVAAGEKETKWTPKLATKPGAKYVWRVRATDGNWNGPEVNAHFVTKGKR
jgi:hypothetical protein